MPVFSNSSNCWPGINKTKGVIDTDDGRSFSYCCSRDLTFSVFLNSDLVVCGIKPDAKDTTIELLSHGSVLGYVYSGVFKPKFEFNGVAYKYPSIFRPVISELGLTFSRRDLFAGGPNWVDVADEPSEMIAIAILVYCHAWGTFVVD